MRTLIFTATYNESDNIASLVTDCLQQLPDADMLVVDDHSPDGTGRIVADLRATFGSRIVLIERPRKMGLGTAHQLGIRYAVAEKYDSLITMDADYSHHPRYLAPISEALLEHDFVNGSRYGLGGRCDYGPLRLSISRIANALTRHILGIPLTETTSSLRGFRISLLERMPVNSIKAEGYAFFFESIYQACRFARSTHEFPIHFEDRRAGTSKISKKEIVRAVFHLIRLLGARITRTLPLERECVPQSKVAEEPCDLCGYAFYSEIYPARNQGHQAETYRCTTAQHGSHGRIVKCLTCGLVATNPKLPETRLNELYSQVCDDEYVTNIPSRERTFRYNFARIRHLLPSRGALLDVGSYYGVFLNQARAEGFDASGVEPSHSACEFSKSKYNVDVLCGTLRDRTPRADCDIVTSWDVLEHCYSPSDEVARVALSLKSGGKFAFCTLNWQNWYARCLGEKWPWLIDMHLYYFDDDVIEDLLARHGLRLIYASTYCHVITADYLLKKLVRLRIPFAASVSKAAGILPLQKLMVPFRFGDIRMYVAEKM
jgi:dolichol-phosphate mannosyltransferase